MAEITTMLTQGDEAAARQRVAAALEPVRTALGARSFGYASALLALGFELKREAAFSVAEPCYAEAVSILREIPHDQATGLAIALNNLAELYRAWVRYGDAKSLYAEALEILRAQREAHREFFARVLNNRGLLHKGQGKYRAAERDLKEALDECIAALGEDAALTASFRSNLAGLYIDTGREERARPLYEAAIDVLSRTPGSDDLLAVALNNYATFHRGLANYDEAEPLYERAIGLWRLLDDHVKLASGLDNLAGIRYLVKDFQSSVARFREASGIWRRLGGYPQDLAKSLEGLALALDRTGDEEECAQLLDEALTIRRAVLPEDHLDIGMSLFNIASHLADSALYAEAEVHYRSAETIAREQPPARLLRDVLLGLIELLGATSRPEQALDLAREVAQIDAHEIMRVSAAASEDEYLVWLSDQATGLHTTLSLVMAFFADSATVAGEAFDLVIRQKCITADVVAVRRLAGGSGHSRSLLDDVREWKALQAQMQAEAWSARAGGESVIAGLSARAEALELKIAGRLPQVNLERRLASFSRVDITDRLPDNSALVEIIRSPVFTFDAQECPAHWGPEHYLAFVVTDDSADPVRLVDLGEAETCEKAVADLLSAISRQVEANAVTVSTSLRSSIFDPLVPLLRGRTRVVIAPDGELSKLPFEVLRLEGSKRVIDDYTVSYLAVARDLLPRPRRGATSNPPLVLADPDFDLAGDAVHPGAARSLRLSRSLRRSDLTWPRLDATRDEGVAIGEILGVPPAMGRDATDPCFTGARSPRVLHVATHGFFLPDLDLPVANPLLRSGLVLAGGNRAFAGETLPPGFGDGVVNAEEVMAMDLHATELVVLSACETGLGEARDGEGVFGLRRAFPLAGCETVVMSLWLVPDSETQILMVDLYRRLGQGASRVEALRESQLAIRQTCDDPYFWGAFICHGNGEPLATPLRNHAH